MPAPVKYVDPVSAPEMPTTPPVTPATEQWQALYEQHSRYVYYLALRTVGDQTLAEDITHDVFLKAYRHLDQFRGQAGLRTWLYRITINHCQNVQRAWQKRNIISTGDPQVLADAAGRCVDAELLRHAPQDRAARGSRAGFPDPGAARPRRNGADQPVRNRIARTDLIAGHRRPCRRPHKRLTGLRRDFYSYDKPKRDSHSTSRLSRVFRTLIRSSVVRIGAVPDPARSRLPQPPTMHIRIPPGLTVCECRMKSRLKRDGIRLNCHRA